MTKEQKAHYDKVARQGCVLCAVLGYGESPAEIHHIRRNGGKRTDAPVIGLCPEHHRGSTGVHGLGRKAFAIRHGFTEEDLLQILTTTFERK